MTTGSMDAGYDTRSDQSVAVRHRDDRIGTSCASPTVERANANVHDPQREH